MAIDGWGVAKARGHLDDVLWGKEVVLLTCSSTSHSKKNAFKFFNCFVTHRRWVLLNFYAVKSLTIHKVCMQS